MMCNGYYNNLSYSGKQAYKQKLRTMILRANKDLVFYKSLSSVAGFHGVKACTDYINWCKQKLNRLT